MRICQPRGLYPAHLGMVSPCLPYSPSPALPPNQAPKNSALSLRFEPQIWCCRQCMWQSTTRWATTQRADAPPFSKAPTKLLNAQHMHMSLLLLLLLHNMPFLHCQNILIVKKSSTCSGGSLQFVQLAIVCHDQFVIDPWATRFLFINFQK